MEKLEKYHYYLDAIEEDIPDALFAGVETQAKAAPDADVAAKYLLGLCLLHANHHPEALKLFQQCAERYPLAVNPKLYYILTSIELNYPSSSEVGYRRDFYLFELRAVESNSHIHGMLMAFDGLQMIWNKQRLGGVEKIKQAEVLSGNFYPAQLLIARAYAAVGENTIFQQYRQRLFESHPRLEKISGTVFSGQPL